MLVLSRKLGEKIIINGDIVVTVVRIDRNQIRLGIDAPAGVPVYRQEIAPVLVDRAEPPAPPRQPSSLVSPPVGAGPDQPDARRARLPRY